MAKLNKWTIIGNLGNDPEIRYTQNGTKVMTLSVAVDQGRMKDGEWVDSTVWARVSLFNEKQIDYLEKILQKGSTVYVDGRPTFSIYNGERGSRINADVMADNVQGLARLIPKEGDEQPRQAAPAGRQPAANDDLDNLPF